MAGKVTFELVSPERLLEATEADMVVVPGSEGDFGVLPGHVPTISTLRPGVIEVYDGSAVRQRIMVTGGFAEVSNDRLTILVEEAMPLAEVSAEQLDGKIRQATEVVSEAGDLAARESAEKQLLTAQDLRRAFDYYASR